MARPKEFDVDDALARALDVFWRQGYAATSMQDLVDAMGIQKASLYGTFTDKRSLYVAALRSYQQQGLDMLARELAAATSPKAAVRAFVRGAAEQSCGRLGKRGCFCVNANVEMAPGDPEIAELLRAHSERIEGLLAQALQRAKAQGELPKGVDCARLATFLFGVVVALNVLGKQRAGRERMTALADQGLAALEV